MLPKNEQLLAIVVRDETQNPIGLAVFGRRRTLRHRLLRSLGYYLHETGERHYDCLTIEYNGLIADRGWLTVVANACVAALGNYSPDWDELFISGIDSAQCAAFQAAARKQRLLHRVLYEKVCHFVDLDAVRTKGEYLHAISRNTRYQLRRAIRIYEKDGSVRFECARSVDEAILFLEKLRGLHQVSWRARGESGSFANPFFDSFHRELVRDRFAAGEIQLAKISTPAAVIGYLYNFVFRDTVYAYQSGFHYEADSKRKPGLVSHYLAIDYNLRAGAKIYDFMAGEGQHKGSLGTNTRSLVWLVEQRSRVKLRLENALRELKQRLAPQ